MIKYLVFAVVISLHTFVLSSEIAKKAPPEDIGSKFSKWKTIDQLKKLLIENKNEAKLFLFAQGSPDEQVNLLRQKQYDLLMDLLSNNNPPIKEIKRFVYDSYKLANSQNLSREDFAFIKQCLSFLPSITFIITGNSDIIKFCSKHYIFQKQFEVDGKNIIVLSDSFLSPMYSTGIKGKELPQHMLDEFLDICLEQIVNNNDQPLNTNYSIDIFSRDLNLLSELNNTYTNNDTYCKFIASYPFSLKSPILISYNSANTEHASLLLNVYYEIAIKPSSDAVKESFMQNASAYYPEIKITE